MTVQTTAARLVRHDASLEVADVELADPGPDEVLVELAFAGVNPVDRYNAQGRVAADGPLPRTLGSEGSGHVDGRAVVVRGHGLGSRRDGTWARAAVVPRAAVHELPDGVDLAAAAALGVAGLTAWRTVVELGEVATGDRVLVLGAAGGVGSIAVSVAHHLGATVWGQTSDPEKVDFIRQRGADEVVVADANSLVDAIRMLRPTVVLDPLGDGFSAAAIAALEPFGRLVLFGASAGGEGELSLRDLYRKGVSILGYGGLIEPEERMGPACAAAIEALARGDLEIAIGLRFPLGEVNAALDALASRKVLGKLVLDCRA